MARRLLTIVSAGIAVLLVVAACGGKADDGDSSPISTSADAIAPIDLVPDGASALVWADVLRLLNDQVIQDAFFALSSGEDAEEKQTLEQALAELTEKTGLDAKQIEEMLFFANDADLSTATQAVGFSDSPDLDDSSGVAILSGSFDPDAILSLARQYEQTPTSMDYKGYELIMDVDETTAITAVGNYIVTGDIASVQDVIDVATGERAAVSGNLRSEFEALGSPLIKGVVEVPEGTLDDALGEDAAPGAPTGFGFDLSAVSAITRLSFMADVEGQFITSHIRMGYPDETMALEAADFIDSALTLFGGFFGTPELRAFLDGIEVTQDGDTVDIDILILPSSLSGVQALGEAI